MSNTILTMKTIKFAVTPMYLLVFGVALLGFQKVYADGNDGNEWSDKTPQVQPAPPSPQGKLDPRLPPMLPGEPVVRGGKKMNVWTTSGPVPVSEAPEPFQEKNRIHVDDVDVIVDRDHGRYGHSE